MNDLKPALAQLAKDCGARKLVLFGSRARGDNRPRSDIDLAARGAADAVLVRHGRSADPAEIRRCVCR